MRKKGKFKKGLTLSTWDIKGKNTKKEKRKRKKEGKKK